jgi:hypothetical protein
MSIGATVRIAGRMGRTATVVEIHGDMVIVAHEMGREQVHTSLLTVL